MKNRISITIDGEVLKEMDRMVDGIRVRSRSDAIERILKENVIDRKTAVILAGGNPSKLLIKGLNQYRPLVNVGKIKLIEDTITKCREGGFVNIVIIGFTSLISKIYEVLGNGEKYNVNIIYIEEQKELGTAKSLELAKKYLRTDFLFLPCDFYIGFDLKKLLQFHNLNNNLVTMGVHARTSYDWNRGIVEMEGMKIINYEENPKNPKTRLVGLLAGFMKPEIFNNIPPGDIYWSLQENVFPKLAKEGNMVGYQVPGNWVNVHEEKDVKKVNEMIRKNK